MMSELEKSMNEQELLGLLQQQYIKDMEDELARQEAIAYERRQQESGR